MDKDIVIYAEIQIIKWNLWKNYMSQTGQFGKNGQIARNIQTTKTEAESNGKPEQTHNQQRN